MLDRVITPDTPLDEAAKCALVSMDSTLKSNLSVGLPLDMVVYEADRFQTDRVMCIDDQNPYFQMLHGSWGQKLREVFDSIEDPTWDGERDQGAADGGIGAQQAAQEDHLTEGKADLTGPIGPTKKSALVIDKGRLEGPPGSECSLRRFSARERLAGDPQQHEGSDQGQHHGEGQTDERGGDHLGGMTQQDQRFRSRPASQAVPCQRSKPGKPMPTKGSETA